MYHKTKTQQKRQKRNNGQEIEYIFISALNNQVCAMSLYGALRPWW
jgi:hypothetical protein